MVSMITTNTVENVIITYLFSEGYLSIFIGKKFSYDNDLCDNHNMCSIYLSQIK